MALNNTNLRYGSITKSFHWLTALLILTLIPLGWFAGQLPYETSEELARKAWLFSLHKTLGVTTFFVALARIIWALGQPKPGLLNADHKLESSAADMVHWLLYGALVVVPLSGWVAHAAAAGFAPIWWPFGQGLPLVPKNTTIEHLFGALHWVSGRVLILSLVLHIAGALKHQIIDRDATLRRMLPGDTNLGPLPTQGHGKTSAIAAFAVWGLAFLVAFSLGSTEDEETTAVPSLEAVSSQWQVQNGAIEIEVVQFGNEVTGQFEDWTAEITFDETIPMGIKGHVTATVSIPSLTLGSVTQQALGADFFDAQSHPTATFDGEISDAADGYQAVGTLTIKGHTTPFTLPFGLALDGDNVEMRGDLTLDRRSFAIGDNMPDADSLAFTVKVKITLNALRTTDTDPAR